MLTVIMNVKNEGEYPRCFFNWRRLITCSTCDQLDVRPSVPVCGRGVQFFDPEKITEGCCRSHECRVLVEYSEEMIKKADEILRKEVKGNG